jgi:hypothetical protein
LFLPRPSRPASALFRLAKHTSAAVINAYFISRLLDIQAERERDVIANDCRQTPCPADSAGFSPTEPLPHCPYFSDGVDSVE